MIRPFPPKDPDSRLRYWFNWTPWISVEAGGTIASYEVVIEDGDGALVVEGTAIGTGEFASYIMAILSGGTEDVQYTVRSRVTLTDGSTEDASRSITVTPH